MKEEKVALLIIYVFGVLIGVISFYLNNYLLSLLASLSIYFGLYLSFRKLFSPEKYISETAVGYFGLWFLTWTILLNLIG